MVAFGCSVQCLVVCVSTVQTRLVRSNNWAANLVPGRTVVAVDSVFAVSPSSRIDRSIYIESQRNAMLLLYTSILPIGDCVNSSTIIMSSTTTISTIIRHTPKVFLHLDSFRILQETHNTILKPKGSFNCFHNLSTGLHSFFCCLNGREIWARLEYKR